MLGALLCLLALLAAPAALAQDVPDEEKESGSSRAEILREERAEKEEHLSEPEEPWLKEASLWVEENQVVLDFPDVYFYGLRPVFGGLRSGAGYTGGLRFAPLREESNTMLAVEGLVSQRLYWAVQGVVGYETGAFFTYGFGRYRHLPQEPFYGIGANASGRESNFTWDEGLAGGLAGVSLNRRVFVGATGAYQSNRLGEGTDENQPTLSEAIDRYGPVTGYDPSAAEPYVETDYVIGGAFIELDFRDIAYNVRYGSRFAPNWRGRRGLSLDAEHGVYAAASVQRHQPLGGPDSLGYNRYEVDLQQFVPLRHGFQVLALRQFVSIADGDVPFYKMPTLGGGRSLRGFDTFRFRDRNAALLNAEFRWNVWVRLDMALFLDAGYAFEGVDEIQLEDAELGYGVGFRYLTSKGNVAARADIAYSRQGPRLYLKLGGIL